MTHLTHQELTPAQHAAIDKWWSENNPDAFDNMDNTRYAVKGNLEQEAGYFELESHGCCGYVDVELDVEDGESSHVLLYGFNYGH